LSDKPVACVLVPLEDDLLAQIEEKCEVRVLDNTTPRPELLAALSDVEGVLVSPRIPADAAFFDAAPKLRVLSTHSVGYDPFDIPSATEHGVVVCNTPGVLTAAVANLTMALILNLTLRLKDNEAFVRSGGWARREQAPPLGHDIQGKTLGVIGFGRIGQEVTARMQALGTKTLWYDVFDTPHPDAPESTYKSLDDLLAEADFVSMHTNLDATSRHMIGTDQLARMKPTAYLINTARGPLVDQVALTAALQNGQIAGAALDVLESEPPAEDDPVFTLPNVICFPHIGTATEETRRLMRELAVRNLLAVLSGEMPPTPVNPQVLTG
jgi:glyoxylate reductase